MFGLIFSLWDTIILYSETSYKSELNYNKKNYTAYAESCTSTCFMMPIQTNK